MYNVLNTLAPLFFIESSSFMQVKRATIISRSSSKFGTIRPHTAELAAFKRLKNSHRLEKIVSKSFNGINCSKGLN